MRHSGSPYAGLAPAAGAAAVLFGLGAFAIAAVFMGLDYFAVRGHPTEHAVVVSVEPSGTKEVCGRSLTAATPGERTTYRSQDAPTGLPVEFAVNHCPGQDDRPGDLVTVRRTGTGQDDVYVEPIESAGQWLGMSSIVGLVTAVLAGAGVGLKESWDAYRGQRRRARHSRPSD